MKKYLIALYLILPLYLTAQKEDKVWIMGYGSTFPNGGIHWSFEVDSLHQAWFNLPIWMDMTNASICDKNGNLLFYTNGWMIANNNLDIMMNGDSLSPCQYSYDFGPYGLGIPQGAMILPMPDDSNLFYLFHTTVDDLTESYADKILYSTIDKRLDGGLGGVVSKNITLITDSMAAGLITAVRHANGRDWWVVIPKYGGGQFYIFLLSPAGISDLHIQNVGLSNNQPLLNQAAFSPDGSIYARNEYMQGGVYIYDFDRCDGVFSNSRYIPLTPIKPGGIAISPNSKVLYITAGDTILQYDLSAGNIAATQQVVAVYDGFVSPFATSFFLAQLAPDGKIYINSTSGVNVMHVIDYPDSLGLACHVCQHCISLPAYNASSIPNFPNFRLGALVGSPCDTLHIGITETENIISGKLYPNPARDWIIFEPSKSFTEKAELQLYNILGKKVLSQTLNPMQGQYNVKVSGLTEGMYFVRVSKKDGLLFNNKLVIQK